MSKSTMRGSIKYVEAAQDNPLQTKLRLILTDFEPNANKQGVPLSEADNIIRTAIHSPIKINFAGKRINGHLGAIPIGPIINAYKTEYNGREVIEGEAIIWNTMYEGIATYVKEAFAEGVGTSWEIFYENETIDNDVEWLNGCVFGGTCIVEVPAYGKERARILAVAETLFGDLEIMNKDQVIELIKKVNQFLGVEENVAFAEEVDVVVVLNDKLTALAEVLNNAKDEVVTLKTNNEQLTTELTTFKEAEAEARLAQEKKDKLTSRRNALSEVNVVFSDEDFTARESFILGLDDAMFVTYVADMGNLAKKQGKAEKRLFPEPFNTTNVDMNELAESLKAQFNK